MLKRTFFLIALSLTLLGTSSSAFALGPEDPPLTDWGCRYENYQFGNNGEYVPPPQYYRYCVCDQHPGSIYPESWLMPSDGYTWPPQYCQQVGGSGGTL